MFPECWNIEFREHEVLDQLEHVQALGQLSLFHPGRSNSQTHVNNQVYDKVATVGIEEYSNFCRMNRGSNSRSQFAFLKMRSSGSGYDLAWMNRTFSGVFSWNLESLTPLAKGKKPILWIAGWFCPGAVSRAISLPSAYRIIFRVSLLEVMTYRTHFPDICSASSGFLFCNGHKSINNSLGDISGRVPLPFSQFLHPLQALHPPHRPPPSSALQMA